MRSRDDVLNSLRAQQETAQPVVIVGAGINGIGLYRDLALQGVPSILIDKGDFSSGTSAAPSRLIHGGLRYLETGEFALVRESVVERNQLLINASYLVKPLATWVPAFSWFGGAFSALLRFLGLKKTPGSKGILVVLLGLMFYDWFARGNRTMPKHRLVPRAASRRQMPGLSPAVRAVAEYYDARLVHPERLALELVGDAERDCPEAIAIPYVSLEALQDGRVVLRDELSGERFALRPDALVNCAGAWADRVNHSLGIDQRLIGGTRGSHLVMRRPDIARQLGDCMLYFETHDHRACLVYALDDELILLGSTDIRDDSPDNASCTQAEISYLFGVLEEVLPGSNARPGEVVFAYAGIRPLPWSGASATGAISRDHAFKLFEGSTERPFPVMTLVGGKWTTYRACAEDNSKVLLGHLGKAHERSTLELPVGGSAGLPRDKAGFAAFTAGLAREGNLDDHVAARLVRRYGSTAAQIAPELARAPRVLASGATYQEGEIRWIIRNERVTRLQDIILRRTLLPFEGALSGEIIHSIGQIAAAELGWSEDRLLEEIRDTTAILGQRHHVSVLTGAGSPGLAG